MFPPFALISSRTFWISSSVVLGLKVIFVPAQLLLAWRVGGGVEEWGSYDIRMHVEGCSLKVFFLEVSCFLVLVMMSLLLLSGWKEWKGG
ncbi:hypothetical protein L873DRAFT_696533 [Choiromyces venosus 120613-1]|uniref:Uncharacterized protein n=1 Tax=Choiromyces venosus 120613-1 TaxID=1336337 RepID=A0A3N4JVJ5_9PEZI|nr:hypothetical protein L873DRAFT_696533 [Choiromyces venosus 120613-1]